MITRARSLIAVTLLASRGAVESFSITSSTKVINSEADLVSLLNETQQAFQKISPPSNDMFIIRDRVPYPLDWSGFDMEDHDVQL